MLIETAWDEDGEATSWRVDPWWDEIPSGRQCGTVVTHVVTFLVMLVMVAIVMVIW